MGFESSRWPGARTESHGHRDSIGPGHRDRRRSPSHGDPGPGLGPDPGWSRTRKVAEFCGPAQPSPGRAVPVTALVSSYRQQLTWRAKRLAAADRVPGRPSGVRGGRRPCPGAPGRGRRRSGCHGAIVVIPRPGTPQRLWVNHDGPGCTGRTVPVPFRGVPRSPSRRPAGGTRKDTGSGQGAALGSGRMGRDPVSGPRSGHGHGQGARASGERQSRSNKLLARARTLSRGCYPDGPRCRAVDDRDYGY